MHSVETPTERPRALCPDDDLIERLALGLVALAEEERLDDHVARCPSCAARHEAYFVPLVETLRNSGPPETITDTQQLSALLPKLESLLGSAAPPAKPKDAPQATTLRECLAELGLDFHPNEEPRIGKYLLLEVFGKGGMGMVFRGRDAKLGREVAIKVMKPEVAAVPAYRERFTREARAAAQLQHDHIVPVFEVDEFRGVPYIVMPRMKGQSLHELLAGRKLDYSTSCRVLAQAARGLAFAHAQGLIHRDIKPANLWVEAHGEGHRVRILDFGLVHDPGEANALTHTGAMMGTPGYMAPEQARGEKIDARADLFSLGCVLYEMLTRKLPFTGTNPFDVAFKVATEEPPTPRQLCPDVPQALSRLTMRLLSKRPEDRPASAKELLDELKSVLAAPKAEAAAKAGSTAKLELPPEPVRPQVTNVLPAANQRLQPTETPPPLPIAPSPAKPRPRRLDTTLPDRPARQKRFPLRFALAAFGFLSLLLGGMTVYRISTDKGELVIESDDPDVQLKIEKGGDVVEVVDAKSGTKIRLQSGVYSITAQGSAEVSVTPTIVRLVRDGVERVSVKRVTAAPVPKTEPKVATSPDTAERGEPAIDRERKAQVKLIMSEPNEYVWEFKGKYNDYLAMKLKGEVYALGVKNDKDEQFVLESTREEQVRIKHVYYGRYLRIDKEGKVDSVRTPTEDCEFVVSKRDGFSVVIESVARGLALRMQRDSRVLAVPANNRSDPERWEEMRFEVSHARKHLNPVNKRIRFLVRAQEKIETENERAVTELDYLRNRNESQRFSADINGQFFWWDPQGSPPTGGPSIAFVDHKEEIWNLKLLSDGPGEPFRFQISKESGLKLEPDSLQMMTPTKEKLWVRIDPNPKPVAHLNPADPAAKAEAALRKQLESQARLMMNEPDDHVWEFKGKHGCFLAMSPTGELYDLTEKNGKDERFLVESTRFGQARLRHAEYSRYVRIDKAGKVSSVESPNDDCEVIVHKRDSYSIGIESVPHRLGLCMNQNGQVVAPNAKGTPVVDTREDSKFEVSPVKKVVNPVGKRLRMLVRDAENLENEREVTELDFQYHLNGASRRFSAGNDGRLSVWDPSQSTPPEARMFLDFIDHDNVPVSLTLFRKSPDEAFRFKTVALGWLKLERESIHLLTPLGKKIWVRLDPNP